MQQSKMKPSTPETVQPRSRSYRTSKVPDTNSRGSAAESSGTGSDTRVVTPTGRREMRGGRSRGGFRAKPDYVPYITQPANDSEYTPQMATTQRAGTRGGSQLNTGRRPAKMPLLKPKEDWMEWQSITLIVRRLPPQTTTWDLWDSFSSEGTIVFIELLQTKGERDGGAKVRFQPPPARNFWHQGQFSVRVADRDVPVLAYIELMPRSHKGRIQSPVRKGIDYPELMKLFTATIDFGFMLDPKTMMQMRSIQPLESEDKEFAFQVDLFRKRIAFYFPYHFSDPNRDPGTKNLDRINHYKVWIPFEQIEKIYSVDINPTQTSFILSLDSPPSFYRLRSDIEKSHVKEALIWSEMDTWYRQTDIIYDPKALLRNPLSLNKGELEIDIGRWTTYRFVFERNTANNAFFKDIHESLKDFNIPTLPMEGFNVVPPSEPKFWSLVDGDPNASQSALTLLEQGHNDFHLPFAVRYQLEVCISQGVLLEHNLTADFLAVLVGLARQNTAKAQSILEYFAEMESRVHDPMTMFENKDALARAIRTKIPHYCAYARKATVTPSGVYFTTPSVETTNRVTRQFSEHADRFLRVQFTDEKSQGRLNSNVDKVHNDELYSRVYRTLNHGILIGDRKYEYLAFGNSQFRENGAYFFCPNEDISREDIRAWMGSFDHIRVVAKYAARLGQCFSTTRAIHGTKVDSIGKIRDIERNGYNFTDGVGKISEFLAQMIATELGLPIAAHVPSAFQFRLGGCKGILVVWPDVTGRQLQIRPSQEKFKAVYNGLEIVRCSQFSTATLNRQTISILSELGVPDAVFLRMLTKQLSDYQTAMTDRSMALSLLQKFVDVNSMTITIASMIVSGFMEQKEPFLMSLLHLWRAWSIKLLKEKARILVENGAFVFGCIDETATLKGHRNNAKPGYEPDLPEIFLQVPESGNPEKYRVVEGVCLIGRNPSLHPGDLRVVKAVDVPALRHLRNVVVFPQLGDRDIPSMCSGGDLDGDDFFVIWDKDLTPNQWNSKPMNYDAPAPKEKTNGPVTNEDIIKFFVRYMKNDALPTIAQAHLAQADQLPGGVFNPACLQLAELHSKAVDFPKSGEPAVMPKKLRPKKWPNFMEKKYKPKEQTYESTKILGQLYKRVEAVDFVPQYTQPFDQRVLRAYRPLDSAMLKTARQIKTQYDTAMKRIMAQMEIATEFEVYSTFVLSKPRVGSDYKLQEDMSFISGSLKDRFRAVCIEAAGSKDFSILAPFVASMYQVTWEEMQIALAECNATKMVGGREVPKRKMLPKFMPLISFPWIFHEILGRIGAGTDVEDALEDLRMPVLRSGIQRRKRVVEDLLDEEGDFIETAEGITHRGEVLDLFRPDYNSDLEDAMDAMDADMELHDNDPNTAARNREVEARRLDSANIVPHDDTGLDDEFDGLELDGFLNPSRDTEALNSASLPVERSSKAFETLSFYGSIPPQHNSPVEKDVGDQAYGENARCYLPEIRKEGVYHAVETQYNATDGKEISRNGLDTGSSSSDENAIDTPVSANGASPVDEEFPYSLPIGEANDSSNGVPGSKADEKDSDEKDSDEKDSADEDSGFEEEELIITLDDAEEESPMDKLARLLEGSGQSQKAAQFSNNMAMPGGSQLQSSPVGQHQAAGVQSEDVNEAKEVPGFRSNKLLARGPA